MKTDASFRRARPGIAVVIALLAGLLTVVIVARRAPQREVADTADARSAPVPGPGAAVFSEDAKHRDNAELLKRLKEAHDDLEAKRYADAISKLKAAEAMQGKTPYDQHLINDMRGFAYIRTNNFPEAAKALEAELNDGFTPANGVPSRVRALAQLNYQIKNYGKAIEYGKLALKGGYHGDEMRTLVGQAYYLDGDWPATIEFEDELVGADIKRGETPKRESLQLLRSACVKLGDNECARRALEWLNQYYPGMN